MEVTSEELAQLPPWGRLQPGTVDVIGHRALVEEAGMNNERVEVSRNVKGFG